MEIYDTGLDNPDISDSHKQVSIGKDQDHVSTPNSRPPLSHALSSKDNQLHGAWSRPSTARGSRPTSARSLFSLNNSISEDNPEGRHLDDLFTVMQSVRNVGDEDTEEITPNKWKNNKRLAVKIIVVLTALVVVAIIGGILSRVLTEEASSKNTNENQSTTTVSPVTGSGVDSNCSPSTTSPLLVFEDNSANDEYGGTWSAWGEWTVCSRSCNAGTRTRYRICESVDMSCIGVAEQQMRCNTALCPIEEPLALWSSWNEWEECSSSCGTGRQTRRRICTSVDESYTATAEDCVGEREQTRDCNTFNCPDCSTSCTVGSLHTSCSYCECENNITGQIISNHHLPLENVTITPVDAPFITLAISTTGGFFSMPGVCLEQTFSFNKPGYVDAVYTLADFAQNITMLQRVPLQIVENPRDIVSISGDTITLYCEVFGVPEPDYYEWMKNDDVIFTDNYQGLSELQLDNVNPESSGYYQCRSSNDYGAIYSSIATVMVEDNSAGYCSSMPMSEIITLPEGCLYNNETTIDKGKCEGNQCYGGPQSSCRPETRYSCTVTGLSRININCTDYSFPVFIVTSCGCQIFQERELIVYGYAASYDGQPLQYGDIYWNGTLITNTSFDGTFSFSIPRGFSRTSAMFVDALSREFMDTTYIFGSPPESEDSLYIRVYVVRVGMTQLLDSSESSSLIMNDTLIDIPPDSFYTQTGELYVGQVIASFSIINTSNAEDLVAAPGDLTIVDDEGESQQLLSYGMFAMSFEDESGNRLSIPGEITISIPESAIPDPENSTSEIRVWTLNPSTGLWEFASDLQSEEGNTRSKRQIQQNIWGQRTYSATLRGISIDVEWFNFDAISTQTCITKVRLFENDRYREEEQIHNGRVYVVTEDTMGYKSLSTNRVSTDTYNNGYCMVLPCRSHRSTDNAIFRGFIFADGPRSELYPEASPANGGLNAMATSLRYIVSENKIQVDFNERLVHEQGHIGPYYDYERKWRYSSQCSNADFQEHHFRFYELSSCFWGQDTWDVYSNSRHPFHLLLWYDITSHFPYDPVLSPLSRAFWRYKTCFIKVKAPRGAQLKAISYIADERHHFVNDTDNNYYGIRQDCVLDEAVCLEIRPPQRPREGPYRHNPVEEETKTRVVISERRLDLQVLAINSHIIGLPNTPLLSFENETLFQLYLESARSYGNQLGIYCHSGETETIAEQALYMCRNGNGMLSPRQDTVLDNWAVEFGYPPQPRGADCSSLYEAGARVSGIYTIDPDGLGDFEVYCDLNSSPTDGSEPGGWTVIQRRFDLTTDFDRPWSEYESGFGDLNGDFWLGLEKMHRLTSNDGAQLHLSLDGIDNIHRYATYSSFSVGGSDDYYRLHVSVYSGTLNYDGLDYHDNMPFSTTDNNLHARIRLCPLHYGSGWWYMYSNCYRCNLNSNIVFRCADHSLHGAYMKIKRH